MSAAATTNSSSSSRGSSRGGTTERKLVRRAERGSAASGGHSSASSSSADGGGALTNGVAAKRTAPTTSPMHRGVTRQFVRPAGGQARTAPPTPVHMHYNTFRAPFFSSVRSPRREYFTIHPEWASERIVPASWIAATTTTTTSASGSGQQQQQPPSTWTNTYPPPHTGRRCRSAPPGMRSRNPITWENWGL